MCVYGRTRLPSEVIYSSLLFFSTRRGTYASSGSGLRSGGRGVAAGYRGAQELEVDFRALGQQWRLTG